MTWYNIDALLIRHAEPTVAQGTFLGHTDAPLSDEGKQQCVAMKSTLSDYRTRISDGDDRVVWSSDLIRATETASLIGVAKPRLDERLREVNFGQWDGMTYDQIEEQFPGAARQWIEQPSIHSGPGGESLSDVYQRVQSWLSEQVESSPAEQTLRITVVAHFGSLCVLAALLLDMPLERADRLRLGRGQFGHIKGSVLCAWGMPCDHGGFY